MGNQAAVRGEGRERILAAAREVFAQKGFARAGIREIASRAGVTEPPVYWHFKSKRGLFEAAVTEPILTFIRQFFADWQRRPLGKEGAVEEAAEYFSGLYEVLHSERELLLAMLADREFGGGDENGLSPLQGAFNELLELHEQLIRAEVAKRGYRDIDTHLWTRLYFATILSWALHGSLIDPHRSRSKSQVARELAEMSIYGAMIPPGRPVHDSSQ